eukprot:GSMAST32.ASY1.ANO1.1087.1 assembled CDS
MDIGAKAIVVLTQSGATARLVAKYRPSQPILCLTPSTDTARNTNGLLRGVTSRVMYVFFVQMAFLDKQVC